MITLAEIYHWAEHLGVSEQQIHHDHFVSHLLAAVPEHLRLRSLFYGGTALTRTHLDGTRLSEDIDLLVPDVPASTIDIQRALTTHLEREHPDLAWRSLSRTGNAHILSVASNDLQVRIDIRHLGLPERRYPTEARDVALRYSDLPATATFTVPTLTGFAAMKMLAYSDRREPRDLFDLCGLSRLNAFSPSLDDLLRSLAGHGVIHSDFEHVPVSVRDAWVSQLSHQTRSLTSPEDCMDRIRAALP
jgi:predicted nucleotidyltransferase component of viral defense system